MLPELKDLIEKGLFTEVRRSLRASFMFPSRRR